MDVQQPPQDDNQPDNNSKLEPSQADSKKFNIELTVSQANALTCMLPKGYCLQIQRQTKNKRTGNKKKATSTKKQLVNNQIEVEEPSQRITKTKSAQRYTDQMNSLNNYSRAASSNYYQQIDDFMKPCLRILHMLKNHKTSWPFKEPVDPIALNIPNYFDIIKEPMDLQTVEKNLKRKAYATPTQFHADIGKIIRNSYQFNKNNTQFCKFTSEFQQYYNKISSESYTSRTPSYQTANITMPSSIDPKKKKSKGVSRPAEPRFRQPSDTQPATLAQKKALTQQIKKLPKEYLKQVIQIVYEGKSPQAQELNIDNLTTMKIRQLQRYVRDKTSYLQMNSNNQRNEEQEGHDAGHEEESSFESDSDS